MRPELDICVCNPVTNKFTTFEIAIQTSNSAFNLRYSKTRRRYNDFCWLKKILQSHHPMCMMPDLPVKKKWSERFEVQFLVQRMKELGDWIYSVVDESLYLSDTALHLFLQTNLTCKQIDQYLEGQLSSTVVEEAYKQCTVPEQGIFQKNENPDDPVMADTASVPKRTTEDKDSMTERDSGLAPSESESEASSYESESQQYLGSYESAVNGVYPPVSEIYSPEHLEKQSKKSSINCNSNLTSGHMTHSEEHVTSTYGVKGEISEQVNTEGELIHHSEVTTGTHNQITVLADVEVRGEQEGKTDKNSTRTQLIDETKVEEVQHLKRDSHRVEKGNIFSINSQ